MVKYTVFALVITQLLALSLSTAQTLSLGGSDWKAISSNGSVSVPATVPGNIVTDLWKAGLISDPYYRYNDLLYRWIGLDSWNYTKTFVLAPSFLANNVITLRFEGVDTISSIYMNGRFVGSTDNMFKEYSFNVKNLVRTGNNILTVAFTSAEVYAANEMKAYPYTLPSSDDPAQHGELYRNFIRKEASSFSWDWAPCFIPQGIWRSLWIEGYSELAILSVAPQVFPLDSELTQWKVQATVEVSAASPDSGEFNLVVNDAKSSLLVELIPGTHTVNLSVVVNNPLLWWPRGYGEPNLYSLVLTWTSATYSTSLTETLTIGFKLAEMIEEPIAGQTGLTFYLSINKVPIFAKGANWIPVDSFENRVTPSVIHGLLQSAVDANMNILRVWGGGIYQPDSFYEMCDQMGLMVWQEAMFACAMYPRDDDFLNNVRGEIRYQIKRLMSHASLVIFSGNNENEAAMTWYPETRANPNLYAIDYYVLYIQTVRDEIFKHDTTRPFISSSPSKGTISTNPYVLRWGDVSNGNYGDVHYYNYNDYCLDWTKYPKSRFVSEYGLQSYDSFYTIQNISEPSDWYFDSPLWTTRQHHPNGTAQLFAQVQMHFIFNPNDRSLANFLNWIYMTQAIQAVCIRSETEYYRRNKGLAPQTMGAIYWQFNSIWQAPTWSSLEYGGRWKMLHYHAAQMFSQILVSSYVVNGSLQVFVTSDNTRPVKGTLNIVQWKLGSNAPASSRSVPFMLPALGSQQIQAIPMSGLNISTTLWTFQVIDSTNTTLAVNSYVPGPYRAMQWGSASVTAGAFTQVKSNIVAFSVQTNSPIALVWLATSASGRFSDNGFTLVPSGPLQVTFIGDVPILASTLQSTLQITTPVTAQSQK